MKVRPCHQYVAYVRCLEGSNIGLFLGDQKAAEGREVRCNGGAIDSFRMTRVDELLSLTRERNDIVSEDADADIVKVIVRKGSDVSLLFR